MIYASELLNIHAEDIVPIRHSEAASQTHSKVDSELNLQLYKSMDKVDIFS